MLNATIKKTYCRSNRFFCGAAYEARTRYLHLGKVALYRMSYTRGTWLIIADILDLSRPFLKNSGMACLGIFRRKIHRVHCGGGEHGLSDRLWDRVQTWKGAANAFAWLLFYTAGGLPGAPGTADSVGHAGRRRRRGGAADRFHAAKVSLRGGSRGCCCLGSLPGGHRKAWLTAFA